MEFNSAIKRVVLRKDGDGSFSPELNSIKIGDNTYCLKPISDDFEISKGGNSTVFRLLDSESHEDNKVIKISNIFKPNRSSPDTIKRRYGRFINEIDALINIRDSYPNSNVVKIYSEGILTLNDREFPYYVMEKADNDLKSHILAHHEDIDVSERVSLCIDIFKGIKSLHKMDYYHRDIKPDNVLVFYSGGDNERFTWKIGDLGLVAHRNNDYDDLGEKIGPIGWLSPEAMNKFLTEKSNIGLDCRIDNCSDIFQLGKLFWFIFNCNVPIGQLTISDFRFETAEKEIIFDLIYKMLYYSKEKRLTTEEIEDYLFLIGKEFQVI